MRCPIVSCMGKLSQSRIVYKASVDRNELLIEGKNN